MHRTRTMVVALVALGLAFAVTGQRGGAQDAGSTPVPLGSPVPAEECTGDRRSLESLVAFGGTPAAGQPAAPGDVAPGAGAPADEATVAAVTAVLRRNLACTNAGDTLRAFATLTDRLIGELLAQAQAPALDQRLYDLLATPAPRASADQVVLGSVADVRMLPDGSVTALVTTADPDPTVNLVRFIPAGDGYLIDRIDPVQAPPATPTA